MPQDLGWVEYVHPEGKPYFRHPKNKVVTESDITESLTRKKIEYISKALFGELIDSEVELYLVLDQHRQDTYHYYFADHTTQRVFWPEGVDPLRHNLVPPELKGTPYGEFPSRSAHYPPNVVYTDLFIARDYYRHLEFFPCHNELPTDASSFLYDVLVFTCTGKRKGYVCSGASILLIIFLDHLTGVLGSSTTPWNADKAKIFLELLEKVEGMPHHFDSCLKTSSFS